MKTNPNLIAAYQKAIASTGASAANAGATTANSARSAGTAAMNSRSSQLVSSMPGTKSLIPTLSTSLAKQLTAVPTPTVSRVTKTSVTKNTKSTKSATGSATSGSSDAYSSVAHAFTADEVAKIKANAAARKAAAPLNQAQQSAQTFAQQNTQKVAAAAQARRSTNTNTVPQTAAYTQRSGVNNFSAAPNAARMVSQAQQQQTQEENSRKQAETDANIALLKATTGYKYAAQYATISDLTQAAEDGSVDMTDVGSRYRAAEVAHTFETSTTNRDAYAAVMNAMQDSTGASMKKLAESGFYSDSTLQEAQNLYYLNKYAGLDVENTYYGDQQRKTMDVYKKVIGGYYIAYDNLAESSSYDGLDENSKNVLDEYDAAKHSSTYDLLNTDKWNDGQSQAAYEYVEEFTADKQNKKAFDLVRNGFSDEAMLSAGYTQDQISGARSAAALSKHQGYAYTSAQNKVFGTAASDFVKMEAAVAGIVDSSAGAMGLDSALSRAMGDKTEDGFSQFARQTGQSADLLANTASLGLGGNLMNSVAENLLLGATAGGAGLSTGLSLQGAGDQATQNYAAGDSDLSNLYSTLASFGYNYVLNDALNPIANNVGANGSLGYALLEGGVDNAVQDLGTGFADELNNYMLDYYNGHSGDDRQADSLADPSWWKDRAASAATAGLSGAILGGINTGVNAVTGAGVAGQPAQMLEPIPSGMAQQAAAPAELTANQQNVGDMGDMGANISALDNPTGQAYTNDNTNTLTETGALSDAGNLGGAVDVGIESGGAGSGGTGVGAGGNPAGNQRVFRQPVIDDTHEKAFTRADVTAQDVVDQTQNSQLFCNQLNQAILTNKYGLMVSPQTPQSLADKGAVCFTSENGMSGAAVTADGDIEGVFHIPGDGAKRTSYQMIITAIENGGVKLDCYGGDLAQNYEKLGFEAVAKVKFNPEYAPQGWSYGAKDVYVMKLRDGVSAAEVLSRLGKAEADGGFNIQTNAELGAMPYSSDYDTAINYRDSLLDTGYRTESAPYGGNTVGAAQAGETYVSQAADNTVANSATVKNDSALGEAVQQMRAAGAFDVQSVSEARSIRNAENMLQTDKAAETQRLSQHGVDLSEGAQDFDETMMLIADKSVDNATRRTLLKNVVDAWHKAGQALQSAAKYTRTASSTLAKAQQIMQENAEDWASRNSGEQKHIENFSQNLSETLADRADLYNSLGQMKEAISRMIRDSDLSKTAKAQFSPEKVGEMAKIIMNGKDTFDSKAITQMMDTFFDSGLFDLPDSTIDTVMNAYAEAQKYDTNSKAYADAEQKAYAAIADGVTHSTWGDKVRAWRYLSMLSSPRTSIKNAGGNIGMGALTATKDAVKAVLEKAYNTTPAGKKNPLHSAAILVSNADRAAAYADTDAHVYAPLTQNQRYEGAAGIQRGVESNKSIFGNTALENARRMNSASLEGQDVYGSLGFLTAASDLRGDGALTQKARAFSQDAEAKLQKLGENGIIGLGGLKNNYARAAAQYATANGKSYAALTQLESDLRAGYENGQGMSLESLMQDATDAEKTQLKVLAEARAYGVNEALKATFHDTNEIAQKLSQFEKGLLNSDSKLANALGVFIEGTVPFKNTPANVLSRGIEYSPVGLGKAMVDAAQAMSGRSQKSNAEIIDEAAGGVTGTMLFAFGMLAAANGLVNVGKSGDDRKDYYDESIGGQQAYSLNLPGGGTYTLDWTVPSSLPFFVGAAAYGSVASGDAGMDVSQLLDALSNVSEPVLDTTMLSGLNNTLDTLKSDRNGALGSLGTLGLAAAGSYAGQFVPTVAKQIGRSFEDNRSSNYSGADAGAQRIVDKAVNKSTNWIPGLQDEISIDQWGRPQENTGDNPWERLAYNLLSPGYYAQNNSTDVDSALQELYGETGDSSVYPESGINDPTVKLDGENRRMTEQEMQDYSTVRGQTSYNLLDGIVGSDFWNGLSAADKAELVGDVYAYSNAYAHRETFGDDFSVPSSQEKNMEVYDQYGADALINRLEAAPALADASGGQEKAQAVAAMGLSPEDAAVTYAYTMGENSTAMQAFDYGPDMAYYVMQANAAGINGSSKAEDVQTWISRQGFDNATSRQLYKLLKKSAKNPY